MVSYHFPWLIPWKVTLSKKVAYQYLQVAIVELDPVMEDLNFELYEEGEHSKLDYMEYLIILMQITLKGLKLYVSQIIIQSDQETREFLAKQLASKHGEGSSSVSQHEGNKVGESMFSKKLIHVGSLNTKKPSRNELICSISQSKGEEKRTKSEDSLEPSAHGFFEKLFGFSQKRDQHICRIHEDDESPNPPSEGDEEAPCATKDSIVHHLVASTM